MLYDLILSKKYQFIRTNVGSYCWSFSPPLGLLKTIQGNSWGSAAVPPMILLLLEKLKLYVNKFDNDLQGLQNVQKVGQKCRKMCKKWAKILNLLYATAAPPSLGVRSAAMAPFASIS